MATINNVKHLTEEGVYEFLHNPNENYFEGFAVDKEPAFYCPRNCEDGAHEKAVTTRRSLKTAQSALSVPDLLPIHPSSGFCRIIFLKFALN